MSFGRARPLNPNRLYSARFSEPGWNAYVYVRTVYAIMNKHVYYHSLGVRELKYVWRERRVECIRGRWMMFLNTARASERLGRARERRASCARVEG